MTLKDAKSAIESIRRHLQSVGAHKDYTDHCATIEAYVRSLPDGVDDSLQIGEYERGWNDCSDRFSANLGKAIASLPRYGIVTKTHSREEPDYKVIANVTYSASKVVYWDTQEIGITANGKCVLADELPAALLAALGETP